MGNSSSPAESLLAASETFRARDKEYGSAYKRHGKIMQAFLPNGVSLETEDDFTRFSLFSACVGKLNRYANNMAAGKRGHADSTKDLTAYAAMLDSFDRDSRTEPCPSEARS